MNPAFMRKLDLLRDRLGAPVIITSGYRCPVHNGAVSHTGSDGPHTTGKASDVQTRPDKMRELVSLVVELFPGVGFQLKGDHKTRFVHVDDLSPRVWSY